MTTETETAHPDEGTDSWCTPKWLCDALGPFDLDPCSNARSTVNAKVTLTGCGDHDDGLTAPWGNASVFCNPPYSDVTPWARKLAAHPGPWVALLKLDSTTRWFATLVDSGATWAPFRGRLKFESGKKAMTANFASVLFWSRWRPSVELASKLWPPSYSRAA